MNNSTTAASLVEGAVTAYRHGYVPLPIRAGSKTPFISGWTRKTYGSESEVAEGFTGWHDEGASNLGLLLGESSGGLVDVDLDHPKTARLKYHFLPPTEMRSGRAGRPASHFWYLIEGELPSTRRHKMPDGAVAVELRSDQAQTVIPPSVHPSGENYVWEGEPWGGDIGPARVNGRVLTVQVALLALGTVLVDAWPREGGRHDAYLALAGGLLRFGDHGIHPYWERNASVLIRALAEGTADEDGADTRENEVMGSTIRALREGKKAVGFNRLAELIGSAEVDQVRRLVAEVESAAGFESRNATMLPASGDSPAAAPTPGELNPAKEALSARLSALQSERDSTPMEARDPLAERLGSWDLVDTEPYLDGKVQKAMPSVLRRDDGPALLYPGRVNMIYGNSESAKSWIALWTCVQEIDLGERVLYIDLEDEPTNTINRMLEMGAERDDILKLFGYIRPEDPLGRMQRNRWGDLAPTSGGKINEELLDRALDARDPSLIVVDGMTVLYGLHGLDTNDATSTDTITGWLKRLTGNGRRTVVIIDHSTKNAEKGSLPLGSQHKVSMVQGAMLQAWPLRQPMPGTLGEIDLVVLKDRPGEVRRVSAEGTSGGKAQVAARVLMDSTVEGRVRMSVTPPPDPVELAKRTGAAEVDLSASRDAERWEKKQLKKTAPKPPAEKGPTKSELQKTRRRGAVLRILRREATWLLSSELDAMLAAEGEEMQAFARNNVLSLLREEGLVDFKGSTAKRMWRALDAPADGSETPSDPKTQ